MHLMHIERHELYRPWGTPPLLSSVAAVPGRHRPPLQFINDIADPRAVVLSVINGSSLPYQVLGQEDGSKSGTDDFGMASITISIQDPEFRVIVIESQVPGNHTVDMGPVDEVNRPAIERLQKEIKTVLFESFKERRALHSKEGRAVSSDGLTHRTYIDTPPIQDVT